MDTSDHDIVFDGAGVCNHCRRYEERARTELFRGADGEARLRALAQRVKAEGQGKDYDCVIGLSGGADSTMVAYTVRRLGLRALAVHMDNGWDSELAVQNIENAVKALGIDLYTHVVDWAEFKDLHLSFLKASVANSEIPTDHAIVAILYRMAARIGTRYIMSGGNIVTEGVMPAGWMYESTDFKHLKAIHRRFGSRPLTTFPHFSLADFAFWTFVKRIRFIPILNCVEYVREDAAALLKREVDWRDYGAKHYESIYTRFFQGYILPRKFGIDKRRAHFSSLICSGQMSRATALEELTADPCLPEQVAQDKEYVLKKLGLSDTEFDAIMTAPPRSFRDYPSHHLVFRRMPAVLKLVRRVATGRR